MAKAVWSPDLGDGTYKNPIIHADYSDPDVIRAGKDFFMVASSFNSCPALPILHSRDLVNWSIVNHVAPSLPFERYERPDHGRGVWAPSLRCRDGLFYVYFAMPDEGVFMSKTDDPFGEWSPLARVKRVAGWIDPCPFWDDDGSAYLVNAFANSRIGFKSMLRITRMKEDGSEILGEGRFVFDGQADHATIEGPKLYKRNGYYYIFAPAGGVRTGWQTVLRSKDIFGPYEAKIVLHQGDSPVNGPHQGGWVELENGDSWFLHFQDLGAYGRIIHLQPMSWADDWPAMGIDTNGDGIGEPLLRHQKPSVGEACAPSVPATSDDFSKPKLGLQWQWQANPKEDWHSLTARPGRLRLYARAWPPASAGAAKADAAKGGSAGGRSLAELPQVLTQKFPAPVFTAETRVELCCAGGGAASVAGLIVYGDDYRSVALRKGGQGYAIVLYSGGFRIDPFQDIDPASRWEKVEELERLGDGGLSGGDLQKATAAVFRLRVEEGAICSIFYSLDGREFKAAGEAFAARPGIWVGAKAGIFCAAIVEGVVGASARAENYADFEYFKVEP
jgi:hypothetical protein